MNIINYFIIIAIIYSHRWNNNNIRLIIFVRIYFILEKCY